MIVNVKTEAFDNSYPVYINRGITNQIGKYINKLCTFSQVVILTNNRIKRLHLDKLTNSLNSVGIEHHIISIPDGEQYKNYDTYQNIIHKLIRLKIDRSAVIITFGGGVIGDLGGYIAATYKRGINLVHVPTSLIAQIDASIGGKTAIDLPEGKNLVGAFYNPELVITDPELINTLSTRQYINGLFEAIKIGLVHNSRLYNHMSNNLAKILDRDSNCIDKLVKMSVKEKIDIVKADPFEKNLRTVLNFGHTLGHALEKLGQYRKFSHGEAVGWGMLFAIRLGHNLGLSQINCKSEPYFLIKSLLGRRKMDKYDSAKLWQCISLDKKSDRGNIRFVIIEKIGRHRMINLAKSDFIKTIKEL